MDGGEVWILKVWFCIKGFGLQQGLSTKRINSIYTLDSNRIFCKIFGII